MKSARPASKRHINRIDGVDVFLDSWSNPSHPSNSLRITPRSSKSGNIAVTGKAGDYRGYVLSRWHPRFADFLEPGVRDLVLLLVERFGWITYSSCEGHYYGEGSEVPVERAVGIYPRSGRELRKVETRLSSSTAAVNRQLHMSGVLLDVLRNELETEATAHVVVDLVFRRRRFARWGVYFSQVETVYGALIERLKQS